MGKLVAEPRYGFVATAFWTLLGVMVMTAVGFFGARDYFAPKYLQPAAVHANRLQPIRILSPEEAKAIARDAPSRVWTEGVKDSDIPKMPGDDSEKTPASHTGKHTRTGAAKTPTPAKPADATTNPEQPTPGTVQAWPTKPVKPTTAPTTDTPKPPVSTDTPTAPSKEKPDSTEPISPD